MKFITRSALMCLVVAVLFVARGESDDVIKQMLISSASCYHGEAGATFLARAVSLCEGDGERLSRLIRETAATNNWRLVVPMVRCIGRYGSTNDVPFLSDCLESGRAPISAARSIRSILGVCTNSVSRWLQCLSLTNCDIVAREELCYSYIEVSTNESLDVGCRTLIRQGATAYAIGHPFYHPMYDHKMMGCYPDYTYSFARLQALSNGLERNTYAYNLNYITNALRELSEIPVSEFHEFP